MRSDQILVKSDPTGRSGSLSLRSISENRKKIHPTDPDPKLNRRYFATDSTVIFIVVFLKNTAFVHSLVSVVDLPQGQLARKRIF